MSTPDQHDTFPVDLQIGPPTLYNLTQAGLALGLSRKTVRALVDSKLLASVTIGARRYIRRAELERYADGR